MSSNPSDTATNCTSTSTSSSITSTHASSISATSSSTNAPTTTTAATTTTATSSIASLSASSSQATLPLPIRTPSPSPSPSPSPASATATATATATSTATSEEVLSLRSLKDQQREKERKRHKHRHRSRDERKEAELTDEERRARRERRENETPEQRAARRAERAARRAAREQRKHHSVVMHQRVGGGGNSNDMELIPMGASSEHKRAPISPISPASSDDETAPHDTGDNTTADITSSTDEKVLERPLIYYKRSNPVRQRTVKEEGPVQIVFPGNVMCLGENPLKPSREVSQEDEHLVVFSSPNDDQMSRTKVFACLLIFLLPADFILVSTIYFQGSIIDDTSGSQNVTDALTYACTVMALFLGFVGMRLKDTRVLTIFIVVFYIDAVLNLIRIYTILQFSHFIIQLAIGHVMTQYKQTLTGSWFAPVN